ncbi:MAG: sigma-70 family RNA polymerase sigma factor [Anaerolineae bacterium]|jgi:RNA polymerase sigma-70 factor (ECF subfamily)|nr:sigma-70 family RNA polymerase sigma factor [Anaerolineae bacterium]
MMPIVIVLPDLPAEDRLLSRARNGDQNAIMEIYEVYFSPVYGYLRLRVEETMIAEDLASEVFVRLITAFRERKAPTHSLRGWLFKVARTLLYEHHGQKRKFTVTTLEEWVNAPHEYEPEIEFMRETDARRTQAALKQLSEEQQEVLILRFGQMLSLQDTADIMGKSLSAVKSLQFRAVEALRRILVESDGR